MQKKQSFRSKLLLSTILVTGTAISDANAGNVKGGIELPSVEVNFSAIEELRQREIVRKEEELKRRKEAYEANLAYQKKLEQEQAALEIKEQRLKQEEYARQQRIAQEQEAQRRYQEQLAERKRYGEEMARPQRIAQEQEAQRRYQEQLAERKRYEEEVARQQRIAQEREAQRRYQEQMAERKRYEEEMARQQRIAQEREAQRRYQEQLAERKRYEEEVARQQRIAQEQEAQRRYQEQLAERKRYEEEVVRQQRIAQKQENANEVYKAPDASIESANVLPWQVENKEGSKASDSYSYDNKNNYYTINNPARPSNMYVMSIDDYNNTPNFKFDKKYTSEPFSDTQVTADKKELEKEELPYKMVMPRIKPGSEFPVVKEIKKTKEVKDEVAIQEKPPAQQVVLPNKIVKEHRFNSYNDSDADINEVTPGRYQSFIKVTEAPRKTEEAKSEAKSKISYFKVPEKNKPYDKDFYGQKHLIEDDNEFSGKSLEILDIASKLPPINDEGDNISESDDLEVKTNKNKVNDLSDNISVKASDDSSSSNIEGATKGDIKSSIINVVNKVSKVKKLFSFNSDEKESEVVKPISVDKVPQVPELKVKNEVSSNYDYPLNDKKTTSLDSENKALIPVQIGELDEINKELSRGYNSPVYLDGVSNISNWKVPNDFTKKVNKVVPPRNNISSLGGDVQIILPNEVDIERKGNANNIVPKPRVKPNSDLSNLNLELGANNSSKVTFNKIDSSRISSPIDLFVKQGVTSSVSKKQESLTKPTKDVPANKLVKNNNVSARDSISIEKWNDELEKARKKALVAEEKEHKKPVDLSKFKSLLKKPDVDPIQGNEKRRRPSSNPEQKVENKINNDEVSSLPQETNVEPKQPNKIVYLEDIAKSLKKNRTVDSGTNSSRGVEVSKVDISNSSKVTELVGMRVKIPSSEMDLLDTQSAILANNNVFKGLLKINFNDNQLDLSASDNKQIQNLVNNVKSANKKIEIVSFGSSNKVNNARRVSLKRAIAVRNAMLEAGLAGDMVLVQAAGVSQKKEDENTVKILFAE